MKTNPFIYRLISIVLVFIFIHHQLLASAVYIINGIEESALNEFQDFDEAAFCDEFRALDEIEDYLASNNVTRSKLSEVNMAWYGMLGEDVVYAPEVKQSNDGCNPFTAFLMGFGCGAIGVAIVYFAADDRELTEKAMLGCLLWTVISTIYTLSQPTY